MASCEQELVERLEEAKWTCHEQREEIVGLKTKIAELKLLRLIYCPKCGKQIAEKGS